jgi:hypothetical protein
MVPDFAAAGEASGSANSLGNGKFQVQEEQANQVRLGILPVHRTRRDVPQIQAGKSEKSITAALSL